MSLLLPLVMSTVWMWPALVLAGATGYGVYTVSLTSLGDRFDGIELVNGSAAFATMWGIGALFGSTAGGWSMAWFGPHGLPFADVPGLLHAGGRPGVALSIAPQTPLQELVESLGISLAGMCNYDGLV